MHLQLNERRRRRLQFLHHCHLHWTASTAFTSSTHIAMHWLLSISQLIVAQRIHTRVCVSFLQCLDWGSAISVGASRSPLSRNVHSPPTRTSRGTHKVAGPLLIWWRRCHLGREGGQQTLCTTHTWHFAHCLIVSFLFNLCGNLYKADNTHDITGLDSHVILASKVRSPRRIASLSSGEFLFGCLFAKSKDSHPPDLRAITRRE